MLSAGVSAGKRTIQVTKAFQVHTLAADATCQYKATLQCKRHVPLLATPHAIVPAPENVFHVGCLVQALRYPMAWVLLLGIST